MFRLKDTFDLRHKYNDSSKDDMEASDNGEDIQVLTPREEYKMSSAFHAIQGKSSSLESSRFKAPEDRISIGEDSMDDEQPSNSNFGVQGPSTDFDHHIDRLTKLKTTAEWESEGIEMQTTSTGRVLNPISLNTRESTPDSVVSTGMINMRRTQTTGFGPQMNFSAVQENIRPPEDHNEEQTTVKQPYYPKMAAGSQVQEEIKNTMRDHVRFQSADVVDGDVVVPNGFANKDRFYDDHLNKGVRCWPRAILVIFLIGILLAGLIFAIVRFKDGGPTGVLGRVHPDEIDYAECFNVTIRLNETIQFNCTFDTSHPYRQRLINSNVTVIPPYQSSDTNEFGSNRTNLSDSMILWLIGDKINGKRATCASAGVYTLDFTDTKGTILKRTVTLFIENQDDDIQTVITQKQISNSNETYFEVTCSMSGDCNTYSVEFFGRRGKEDILDGNKSCSLNSNDVTGYNIDCTGSFTEDIVRKYSYLGCRMKTLDNHVIQKEFKLPECTNDCKAESPTPYNCSVKSDTRKALDNCSRQFFGQCFDKRRSTFSYKVCSYGVSNCTEDLENLRCRLMWCRIRKNGRTKLVESVTPGSLLCPDSYREITKTTMFPVSSTESSGTNSTTNTNSTDTS